MTRYNWESKGISAKKYSEFVAWVELLDGGEDSLPKLHFVWEEKYSITIPKGVSDEEVLAKFPGVEVEVTRWNGKEDRYFWVSDGKRHHRYLCKFRRYGWCWSPEESGEYCYGHGVVYANCVDGGLDCATPSQVIRETAIAAFWENPNGVPRELLHSRESFEGFEWLVKDAIEHATDHASSPIRWRKEHHGPNHTLARLVRPS